MKDDADEACCPFAIAVGVYVPVITTSGKLSTFISTMRARPGLRVPDFARPVKVPLGAPVFVFEDKSYDIVFVASEKG